MTDMTFITYVEVDGVEFDGVHVHVDQSPAEPDVNWPGGFDVYSIMHDGEEIYSLVSDEEINSLEERLYQELCDAAQDERY